MGTMFRIVLYASDATCARTAISAAFRRIAELDNKLSDYIPDCELNRVSSGGVSSDVPISDELYVVLKASHSLAEATGGAFDVTIGPVVRAWRKARQSRQLPEPAELADARRLVGYQHMHLRDHNVLFDIGGMQLDLGAIAKGYAADEALALLRLHGFPQALVAASGDIAIGDAPPGSAGWRIEVDTLDSPDKPFTRILELHNAAVSTSGDTEQHMDVGGVRYSHIVNPETGIGLAQRIGVTVIASRAIDSDGLHCSETAMRHYQP